MKARLIPVHSRCGTGRSTTIIDARFAEGPITLVKIDSACRVLSAVQGKLETYAQFANSDCLNGAVLRVPDGHRLMRELVSHHYIFFSRRSGDLLDKARASRYDHRDDSAGG